MVYRTAFNPTDGPVVIDEAGRTLAGGEWGPVSTTEDAVKAAMADGRLLEADKPAKGTDIDPRAGEAFEATEKLEKARKAGDPEKVAAAADDLDATPTDRARKTATK